MTKIEVNTEYCSASVLDRIIEGKLVVKLVAGRIGHDFASFHDTVLPVLYYLELFILQILTV